MGAADEAKWEKYWNTLPDRPYEAIWDSEAELTAALHREVFAPFFDPTLPVVDLGCGSGTQTAYLARHYDRAVGFDISTSAINLARARNSGPNVDYVVLDLANSAGVTALHNRIGDANVYMRGIIHQIDPADHGAALEALTILAGTRGGIFVLELARAAQGLLGAAASAPGGPPPKVDRVRTYDLRPASVEDDHFRELLADAGFHIATTGTFPLYTTQTMPDGKRLELPMVYFITSPRGTA